MVKPLGRDFEVQFWKRIHTEPNTGCWLYAGKWAHKGHGVFLLNKETKTKMAHRCSYEHYKGPIPKGMCVCHTCDTPCCVNPDHLFLGTQAENVADMIAKGRSNFVGRSKGCKGGPTLTEEQVRAIRKDPRPKAEIAREYGVRRMAVTKVKRYETWKWVTDE